MTKNRDRSPYSFANINLLGKCNLDCFFCLGKELKDEFNGYNYENTSYLDFKNFGDFLKKCKEEKIQQLYITGQNTDPLQYKYLKELREFLQKEGFCVGLRTNGVFSTLHMEEINKFNTCMGDAVGYTMLSLSKKKTYLMTKTQAVPNWIRIFNETTVPFRVSIVITKYNYRDIVYMLGFLRAFKFNINFKYVQIRRISSDNRCELMKPHQEVYEIVKRYFLMMYPKRSLEKVYERAPIYTVNGLDICLWETVNTTANSLNYFPNGVISDEYFIVEGYLKNKDKYLSNVDRPYVNILPGTRDWILYWKEHPEQQDEMLKYILWLRKNNPTRLLMLTPGIPMLQKEIGDLKYEW